MRNDSLPANQLQQFLNSLKEQTCNHPDQNIAAYNSVYRDISRSLFKANNEVLSILVRALVKNLIVFDDGVKKLKIQDLIYKVSTNSRAYQQRNKLTEVISELQQLATYSYVFEQVDSYTLTTLLQEKFNREKEFEKLYHAVVVFTRLLKSEALTNLLNKSVDFLTEESYKQLLNSKTAFAQDESAKYAPQVLEDLQAVAKTLFNLITDKNIQKELQIATAQEKATYGKDSKEVFTKRLQLFANNVNELTETLLSHAKAFGMISYYTYLFLLDHTKNNSKETAQEYLASPYNIVTTYAGISENTFGRAAVEIILFNSQVTTVINNLDSVEEAEDKKAKISQSIFERNLRILKDFINKSAEATGLEFAKDAATLHNTLEEFNASQTQKDTEQNNNATKANEYLTTHQPEVVARVLEFNKNILNLETEAK